LHEFFYELLFKSSRAHPQIDSGHNEVPNSEMKYFLQDQAILQVNAEIERPHNIIEELKCD
jgi:hypothetical protein